MDAVTLSPKFQLVIPKEIRRSMGLKPGDKFHVFSLDDRIELVPVGHVHEVRGFLKEYDSSFNRDEEERV